MRTGGTTHFLGAHYLFTGERITNIKTRTVKTHKKQKNPFSK